MEKEIRWDHHIQEIDWIDTWLPTDKDGFVVSNFDTKNVWWYGATERFQVSEGDYDFSQHPQIVRDRANQILEENFRAFITVRDNNNSHTPAFLHRYPEPKGEIPESNILIEKWRNGWNYVFIRIFWKSVCLWQVFWSRSQGKGHSKVWSHKKNVVFQVSIQSGIIWTVIWTWNTSQKSYFDFYTKIYDILQEISPSDFPNKNKSWDTPEIQGNVNDTPYTISKIESTWNIRVIFNFQGYKYTLDDILVAMIWNKQYYFIAPWDVDKTVKNNFRKRIWAYGCNQQDAIKKMIRNLLRVLTGNKAQDSYILEYLLKQTDKT